MPFNKLRLKYAENIIEEAAVLLTQQISDEKISHPTVCADSYVVK